MYTALGRITENNKIHITKRNIHRIYF